MRDYWRVGIAFAVIGVGLIGLWSGGPIKRPPGVLVPMDPQQADAMPAVWEHGKFELKARADYVIDARVLSVETYRLDAGSNLAPVDFAVGWGPMSDSAVLDHYRVTQGARFYTIYPDAQALDIREALRHSANMHLIPENARIQTLLQATRPGALVHLEGVLVDASRKDGFSWHTSLTREDTGNGACELFFVRAYRLQ